MQLAYDTAMTQMNPVEEADGGSIVRLFLNMCGIVYNLQLFHRAKTRWSFLPYKPIDAQQQEVESHAGKETCNGIDGIMSLKIERGKEHEDRKWH